jgi:hypothetical protein
MLVIKFRLGAAKFFVYGLPGAGFDQKHNTSLIRYDNNKNRKSALPFDSSAAAKGFS